jgi:hypothetical protein
LSEEGIARLAAVYSGFAWQEAVSRSPLYAELSRGIAADPGLLNRLAALPLEKQQPNLLLAAVKYLFGTVRDWAQFRDLAQSRWDEIKAVMMVRRTQTNEPARCATLLPLLASLPQPLALLEVGASAGLCLLPDKYAYDFGGRRIAPADGTTDAPVFACAANAATPIPARNVDVAWRAGLDLNPLFVTREDDVRWLQALVWPGEGDRSALLDRALSVARRDPPRIVKGDLRHDVERLAAEAPKDATLVIFHTAVLAYVPDAADRRAFAQTAQRLGAQWVSNESPRLFDAPELTERLAGRFLLTLNGVPKAYAESHGAALDWIVPSA